MKKRLFIAIIICMLTNLTACGILYGRNITSLSDEEVADDRVEELINAIEDKDAEKIKEMFSQSTINSVEELDTQIQDFIEFYQGTFVSYDSNGMEVSHEIEYGERKIEYSICHWVVTTKKTYQIAIEDVIMDDFEPKNEGLRCIYIRETEREVDIEKQQAYGGDYNTQPGIYLR